MRKLTILFSVLFLMIFNNIANCKNNSNKSIEIGKASWYSTHTNGTRTASGKKLNNNANTIAHKTLPMGTKVKVTNLKNGKSEICEVSDRGPYLRNRIVDVTVCVAEKLGFKNSGVTMVSVERL